MRYLNGLWILGALALTAPSFAQTAHDVATRVETFLVQQQVGGLYRSFAGALPSRAYAYDQALALLWLSHSARAADQNRAAALRAQLINLQNSDGSWPFAWQWNPSNRQWQAVSETRTGAQIWVMLSLIQASPRPIHSSIEAALARADRWIDARRDGTSERYELIRFTARDLPETGWNELNVVSTEHLIDLYAYWTHRGRDTTRLRSTLQALWGAGHFASGFVFRSGRWIPNRDEVYLDTQTWGRLALRQDWVRLEYSQANLRFPGQARGLTGWSESRHQLRSGTPPLWTEGSYGMLLAQAESGEVSAQSRAWEVFTYEQLAAGIPYALYADENRAPAESFPREQSLAGTIWGAFFLIKQNPFYLR